MSKSQDWRNAGWVDVPEKEPAVASACSNSIAEGMAEELLPIGVRDFRASFDLLIKQTEALEKQAQELGSIRATVMVNFGLNQARHQDGVIVGHECSTHEAMVSVFRQYHERLESLNRSLRNTEDQLIAVANHVGAKCGDGLPVGSGDTLGDAIIRKIKDVV